MVLRAPTLQRHKHPALATRPPLRRARLLWTHAEDPALYPHDGLLVFSGERREVEQARKLTLIIKPSEVLGQGPDLAGVLDLCKGRGRYE